MIHFFRRIRQKLITDNRISKYILYAIGEIALVMIGILLALQVNNWNEYRKERKDETAALIDLKEEFEKNQEVFLAHHTLKKEFEDRWNQFLTDLKNKQSPFRHGMFERPSSGAQTLNITFGSLDAILSTGKIDRISNDSLKHLLTSWNEKMEEYIEDEISHWEFHRNTFQIYETEIRSLPWIGKMAKGEKPEYIFRAKDEIKKNWEKILKDTKYQNLMMLQHWHLVTVIYEGEQFLKQFSQIIELLERELNL